MVKLFREGIIYFFYVLQLFFIFSLFVYNYVKVLHLFYNRQLVLDSCFNQLELPSAVLREARVRDRRVI